MGQITTMEFVLRPWRSNVNARAADPTSPPRNDHVRQRASRGDEPARRLCRVVHGPRVWRGRTADSETAPSSATTGETAPSATASETAPTATAAPKKPKLAKYWTEVCCEGPSSAPCRTCRTYHDATHMFDPSLRNAVLTLVRLVRHADVFHLARSSRFSVLSIQSGNL